MTDELAKIVVGVDFSPESEVAALQALEIARRSGRELVLVHSGAIVELPTVSDSPSPTVREAVEAYRDQLARALEKVREQLAALRERLSGQGVTVSQVLVEDAPAFGVCGVASELRARLTVVGTQGRSGLQLLSMGSVAQGVVRLCENDVLVARSNRADRHEYRSILVGTDFSSSAERALDGAIELASPGAQIHVVNCVALRPAVYGGFGVVEPLPVDLRQALVDDLRIQGQQLLARKEREGIELHFHVSSERPVPGLVHWLETHSYDLAAVGSHGRRGIRRLLLGSVAESVVKRAPCSVLVAHSSPTPVK